MSLGQTFGMDVIEETCKSICSSKKVDDSAVMTQKELKKFLETKLSDKDTKFSCPHTA